MQDANINCKANQMNTVQICKITDQNHEHKCKVSSVNMTSKPTKKFILKKMKRSPSQPTEVIPRVQRQVVSTQGLTQKVLGTCKILRVLMVLKYMPCLLNLYGKTEAQKGTDLIKIWLECITFSPRFLLVEGGGSSSTLESPKQLWVQRDLIYRSL